MSRRQLYNIVSIQNTSTILQCVLSIRPLMECTLYTYDEEIWKRSASWLNIFNVSPGQCVDKDISVKSIFEELVFLYVKYVVQYISVQFNVAINSQELIVALAHNSTNLVRTNNQPPNNIGLHPVVQKQNLRRPILAQGNRLAFLGFLEVLAYHGDHSFLKHHTSFFGGGGTLILVLLSYTAAVFS